MKKFFVATAVTALFATPLLAEGDVAAGEKAFKKCVACHVVVNEAGETLAGKKAKTGPNLYGIAGSTVMSVEGFKYGKSAMDLAATGAAWDEASFSAYVADPTAYLKETLGDSKARSKMSYKVRKEQEAADLYAYLSSLAQ